MGTMQVASWLSEFEPPPEVPEAFIEQLREQLEVTARQAAAVVRGTAPEQLPIRVPKSRLADLDCCERKALAAAQKDHAEQEITESMLRGLALDRFVCHQLVAGRVLEPVQTCVSMLEAEAEDSAIAALEALGPEASAALIDPLAAQVSDAWSGIDPAWVPRTQSKAAAVFADGAVVCSGIIDVELGGPNAGVPGVIVEVKSGKPVAAHQAEAYLYGLLLALRDGLAPGAVARWYPGSDLAAVAVSEGLLESAATRLEQAMLRWAELLCGRTPQESSGPWCGWCPDNAVCPSSRVDPSAPPRSEGDLEFDTEFDPERDW
ncbi:MAG: hypothetical protein F2518_01265 [Actinobacteria bacterium]|nr:hypothetical protein [Actinomycetota bacterium]